ncbi:ParB/RepB/Spo0J family partition protein [Olsenella sp. Marseille-QA0557]|uniref:ParB/RepB/Spo0J family partition protein n=1 Tax=Candidatus Coprovicinus avistercoris TaxID=2840754 RepID=A0A9D1HW77_9ACTN|nr:ParB/RepB/Spo0J family partition protein [Candidatus Coprovicinus avistercoris]
MGEANYEVGAVKADNTLKIDQIKPNPGQPRKNFDETALNELAESIKNNGILQPLLVRKKGKTYEIVAGERRYQAAKIAGLEEVPVVIREISDQEVFQLALIENLQRSDLTPIEEAQGYKQLIEQNGLTQEQLGKVLSKSRSAITNTLRLLDLPNEVQDLIANGKITAGHARAILAVSNEEGRIKLAQKVIDEGLSVRQTETLAPLFSDMKETKRTRTVTPQSYKTAARQLRLTLDANVKVRQVRGKNKIEIEFKDEEDLERLLSSITHSVLEQE